MKIFIFIILWISLFINRIYGDYKIYDIENNTFSSSLISIHNEKCEFSVGEKTYSILIDNLMKIEYKTDNYKTITPNATITLISGDIFQAEILKLDINGVEVKTNMFTSTISIEFIKSIKFHKDKTEEFNEENISEDTVILVNGDKDKGIIKAISFEEVIIESSFFKKDIKYKTDNITYIRFAVINQSKLPDDKVVCLIKDPLSSSYIKGGISNFKDGMLTLDTIFAKGVKIKIDIPFSMYFENTNAKYLSELKPLNVIQKSSLVGGEFQYKNNMNVMGTGPIMINNVIYEKGLGVHSYSELTYEIKEGYNMFCVTVGMDDISKKGNNFIGSVVFVVKVDDIEKYRSKIVRSGDDPIVINLDVAGAKQITLITESADNDIILDRADWANARFIRK